MRVEALRVEAELQHRPPARRREVDDRAGTVVPAVVEHVPLDAGRVERDRLAAAEHEQPVAERLQPDRDLAELGPRSELEPRRGLTGEHADEGGAAAARARLDDACSSVRAGALEPVGDRDAGPARLDAHRAGPVALAERKPLSHRRHREVPGPRAAEDVGEDRGGIRAGVTEPRHARVRGEQRHGRAIGDHRMALDRHRVLAVEPGAARLEQVPEDAHRVDRVVDAVGGPGRAWTDLDPDVRPVQLGERVLVGDVVPEVEDGARRRLRAQGVDGGTLVGRDQRELHHVLAVRDVDPGPGGRAVADRRECLLATLGSGGHERARQRSPASSPGGRPGRPARSPSARRGAGREARGAPDRGAG